MTNVDLFPPPRCYVEFDYSINCTTRKLENLQLLLKQQIHFGNTRIGNMVKTQVCHISQMYIQWSDSNKSREFSFQGWAFINCSEVAELCCWLPTISLRFLAFFKAQKRSKCQQQKQDYNCNDNHDDVKLSQAG